MNGPKREGAYPDRDIDCQEQIAPRLIDILDQAEASGWDRLEAANALAHVANGIQMGERGTDPEE